MLSVVLTGQNILSKRYLEKGDSRTCLKIPSKSTRPDRPTTPTTTPTRPQSVRERPPTTTNNHAQEMAHSLYLCRILSGHAQRRARKRVLSRFPKPGVGGSNPSRRTLRISCKQRHFVALASLHAFERDFVRPTIETLSTAVASSPASPRFWGQGSSASAYGGSTVDGRPVKTVSRMPGQRAAGVHPP